MKCSKMPMHEDLSTGRSQALLCERDGLLIRDLGNKHHLGNFLGFRARGIRFRFRVKKHHAVIASNRVHCCICCYPDITLKIKGHNIQHGEY